jgi:hypothetical protein
MRSGVKLKHILACHSVDLSLNEEGKMELITIDKYTGDATIYEGLNFSSVVDKAYRGVMKDTKERVGKKDSSSF